MHVFISIQVMKKYLKLWSIFTIRTAQIAFESRFGVLIFTLGKLLRFGLHAFFIVIVVSKANSLAGYSFWEIILFFATFNFIDSVTQFLLREVYRFRRQIVSGYFDFVLSWPISPLLKSLFAGADLLDLPMLFISGGLIIYIIGKLQITGTNLLIFLLLIINSLIIAFAFHIIVLALGVVTTEVDNTLWIYRDFSQMARLPVDIYREPLRGLITFIIPIGVMVTFPAKSLLGLLTMEYIILSFAIGVFLLISSIFLWKYALRSYTSASS